MQIETFYDNRSHTLSYVVYDPDTRDAVIIDPVLDYEPIGSKLFTESVDQLMRFIEEKQLTLHAILETHAHADHLSGSQIIKQRYPEATVAMGRRITEVQRLFKTIFDLPDHFATDGRQFDRLLDDGEILEAGSLKLRTLFTPGHTPACTSFQIEDAVFVGDLLFMPDSGTGRCDFPAGSADDLYSSVTQRIYTMPDETRLFVGHDYQPNGREVAWLTTVADQKAGNIQLDGQISRADFVARRTARDATLSAPKLLYQSVQVNIDAGHLPEAGAAGQRYLKIPVNVFRPTPSADRDLEIGPV